MKVPFQLQPTETVTMVLRRHWMHLYPRLALLVLIAVVPPIAIWAAVEAVADATGTARLVLALVGLAWAGGWLVRAYLLWYRYENDVWVVTDQRLVDSLKRHWFHHRMASVDLVDIEDVAVVREGFLRTMFDFGDVQVQTAAQQPNFILSAIPRPSSVLTAIDAARDAARHVAGAR
ncbi:MAG: hypothetical protein KC472_01350 [Dehalococcoidia bacterium]|nr:hypothetical protein [Dehalococcoidia bacterium]